MGQEDYKFFGEYALFEEGNEQDKKRAREYLELWKEFILRRLGDYEVVTPLEYGEHWIERSAVMLGPHSKYASLGFKIAVKRKDSKQSYEL